MTREEELEEEILSLVKELERRYITIQEKDLEIQKLANKLEYCNDLFDDIHSIYKLYEKL